MNEINTITYEVKCGDKVSLVAKEDDMIVLYDSEGGYVRYGFDEIKLVLKAANDLAEKQWSEEMRKKYEKR